MYKKVCELSVLSDGWSLPSLCRFDPRALAVGFVVCEVALGHIFSKLYSFPHHNCSTIDVIYLNK